MDIGFEIKGLAELNKELKNLPEDFRTKALNGAVGAATRLIRDEAINLAPEDSGNLKSAIRAQKKKSPSKYLGKYQVNVNRKKKITVSEQGRKRRSKTTYYARLVEEGTSKMPARPFMRVAFAFKKREAVNKFASVLDKKIVFYQRKIARLRS